MEQKPDFVFFIPISFHTFPFQFCWCETSCLVCHIFPRLLLSYKFTKIIMKPPATIPSSSS
ncbi:hypothetical protein HK096_008876 [Nowakowskiella sp. JEL0078]|nr:hypothetical protein HK096_008876 [Nowakowskiella sp. JEL0078]